MRAEPAGDPGRGRRDPGRGRHAAAAGARAVGADRVPGAPEDRGDEPDRVVQGPRDDGRGLACRRPRRPHRDLRVDREHQRERGRLRGPRRARVRGPRAARQDRARQAGPGPDLRRPAAPGGRQFRRLPGTGAQAGRQQRRGRGQLGQPGPAGRPEDGRVRGRPGAGRCARRALPAGRQRGKRQRLLDGLPGVPGRGLVGPGAADARLPGGWRRAAGQRASRYWTRSPSPRRSGSAIRPHGSWPRRPGTPRAGSSPP